MKSYIHSGTDVKNEGSRITVEKIRTVSSVMPFTIQ